MTADIVVAHLWHRWPPSQGENNTVWSIIVKLKGVDYLSDYDSMKDAGVLRELTGIQGTA